MQVQAFRVQRIPVTPAPKESNCLSHTRTWGENSSEQMVTCRWSGWPSCQISQVGYCPVETVDGQRADLKCSLVLVLGAWSWGWALPLPAGLPLARPLPGTSAFPLPTWKDVVQTDTGGGAGTIS